MFVDRPDDFLGVPGGADLAARVAGIEQPCQSCPASVIEALVGLGEQSSVPVQRQSVDGREWAPVSIVLLFL